MLFIPSKSVIKNNIKRAKPSWYVESAIGMVLGLGLLGTGLAFIIYYYMVKELGAVKASSITYIPPVVALAIGVILVGEDIKIIDILSTCLIFLGVFLINKRKKWF